jgi:hypothetical protein
MKQKIGKSLANSAISIKGVIIIFAVVILTSVFYAQEEGEILIYSEKKGQNGLVFPGGQVNQGIKNPSQGKFVPG